MYYASDDRRANAKWECSGHGKVVGAERAGGVEEKPALAADVPLVIAGSAHTGRPLHRAGVRPALGLRLPLQPDVAALAPAASPAVAGDPIVAERLVSAVAHQLDGVVEREVGVEDTAVVHAACVAAPPVGVHCHSQGSNLSEMGHD